MPVVHELYAEKIGTRWRLLEQLKKALALYAAVQVDTKKD